MVKGFGYVALMLLSLHSASAQDSATLPPAEGRDPKVFGKYERQVAETLESIRRENDLPKLSRIAHREELDQLVCTAALNGVSPWHENRPAALMYETTDPASLTEELKWVARFNQVEARPPFSRYAIAIWPGIDKETGRRIYWVGVKMYMSAFGEFIDDTFTDNRSYRNEWKKMVAPPCRVVR